MEKINYGIDAPKLIRNFLLIGLFLLLCSFFLPENLCAPVSSILRQNAFLPGLCLVVTGLLMIAYAKFGKFRHKDRILNLYDWKGNEQVLDVGTGLGLLMIGAAKRLDTGRSFGIDIFNTYDLSDNSIEHTNRNAALEQVAGKVTIMKENILNTSFNDHTFDVVVSNLCLHNLYKSQEREQACREIYRILKPGGKAIISDFKKTGQYKAVFEQQGMQVEKAGTYFWDTFPPLTIIVATKKQ